METRILVLSVVIALYVFSDTDKGQCDNKLLGKSNSSADENRSGQCRCCDQCNVSHTKIFKNGKNRKRKNCNLVLTPAERRKDENGDYIYNWKSDPILIVVEDLQPYLNVHGFDDKVEISGPMADLLSYLAQTIKFKYCLIRRDDKDWGIKELNLTYSGIYGMVENNEVDIVLGPIFNTVDRFKIMDYSTTIHFEALRALFGKPAVSRNMYNYVTAFKWEVWLVILVTLFIVGVTAIFLYTCGPDSSNNYPLTMYFVERQFWLFFGVLVAQGMGTPPKRCSVRVLNSFWWLVTIILAAYYNSKLIALMVTVKNVNSLDALLQPSSDINVIISSSTLRDVKDSRGLYSLLMQVGGNGTDGEVLTDSYMDLVSQGNYAIVAFSSEIETAVYKRFKDKALCEFNTGDNSYIFTKEMSIGYTKLMDPILRTSIDNQISSIFEKGVFRSMLKHDLNSQVRCLVPTTSSSSAMTMDDVNGIFMLWLYGMTSALCALVLEGIHYSCTYNRRGRMLRRRTKDNLPRRELDNQVQYVERHYKKNRQDRGYANRPFYMAYNSRSRAERLTK